VVQRKGCLLSECRNDLLELMNEMEKGKGEVQTC
jgi:hypothetical protein